MPIQLKRERCSVNYAFLKRVYHIDFWSTMAFDCPAFFFFDWPLKERYSLARCHWKKSNMYAIDQWLNYLEQKNPQIGNTRKSEVVQTVQLINTFPLFKK